MRRPARIARLGSCCATRVPAMESSKAHSFTVVLIDPPGELRKVI
jgi:hypothetical protein